MSSFKESAGFCAACNRQVLTCKEVPNKTFYLLMSVFTCSLWAIFVWLPANILGAFTKFRCTICGGLIGSSPHSKMAAGASPAVKVVACVFGGVFALALIGGLLGSSQRTNSATAQSGNTTPAPPQPTPNPNSADYKSGFNKGVQMGKAIARTPGGMPLPAGIRGMANIQIESAKPANEATWRSGFETGFRKGWESIRGTFKRREEDWEQLSWSNARPGVKLYDYDGKHDVTIIGVDQTAGLITVKYVRNGAIEDKLLNALSQFWWARKNNLTRTR
jgi:hypothetical protein